MNIDFQALYLKLKICRKHFQGKIMEPLTPNIFTRCRLNHAIVRAMIRATICAVNIIKGFKKE